ncbi:protein sprint isoform X2 [Patella vulgata]|uniref:protein sprint isoform X2 n=1 Tax=Patella vulgata TaxID=6465 RepID=UPI0024A93F29|nr:protein sprint isoform X2 [Patella vulgata]
MDYHFPPTCGMLNSIASDLDLLVTDICHTQTGEVTDRGDFNADDCVNVAIYHQEEIKHANLVTCASELSLSSSDNESTSDSGHDDNHHSSSSLQQQTSDTMNKFSDSGQVQMTPTDGYREITLFERLSKTHTIWLLSNIGRTGAVHLLKDLPTGSFLVRQSSQKNSLALSVQCRSERNSTVDHYLIENTDRGLKLQGSAHYFRTIPTLIAHYIQNLDELPHRLILPAAIFHAKTSQELSAIAMLGQDFWTSSKAKVGCLHEGAPLHKSCSEPINITHPKSTAAWCQFPLKISKIPSHSVAEFPTMMKDNSSQTLSEFTEIESRFKPPLVPPKSKLYRSESGVTSPEFEDYQQAEGDYHKQTGSDGRSIDMDSGVDLSKHIYDQSQTHPPVSKKNKSNLYFSTSLDLVNIPETTYFKSSLSDKLSDYEDIWKNSVSDSESVRNNLCQRLNRHLVTDSGTSINMVPRINNNMHPGSDCAVKNVDKTKVDKVLSQKIANTEPGNHGFVKSVKTVQTAELKTFRSEFSKILRKKPPPLAALSRVKSSSTSSLTNLTSPVYMEPVDAVKLNGKSALSVRIRRLSAPSGPLKQMDKQVSRNPGLETILSPRQMIEEKKKFFTFGQQSAQAHLQMQSQRREKRISRSQSMRTGQENRSSGQKIWQRKLLKLNIQNNEHVLQGQQNGDSNRNERTGHVNSFDDSMFSAEDMDNESPSSPLSKFPVYQPPNVTDRNTNRTSYYSESSTVQDMISGAHPELAVRPIHLQHLKRVSEYDNLGQYAAGSNRAPSSVGTVFCKPWDNAFLDNLLEQSLKIHVPAMDPKEKIQQWQEKNKRFEHCPNSNRASVTFSEAPNSVISNDVNNAQTSQSHVRISHHSTNQQSSVNGVSDQRDSCIHASDVESDDDVLLSNDEDDDKFITADLKERMRPMVSKSSCQSTTGPGAKIREYIYRMSQDRSLTFGSTIDNFIQCTLDGQETSPHIVVRNVRQFMTGIKNYLIKHGEGELTDMIERERSKLGSTEILNIDTLIEGALHVCVIRPLKHYIYRLFVQHHSKNGNLELMSANIKYARNKTPQEIGIKPGIQPPQGSDMELIKHHLGKMQRAYSPVKKLENLLAATSTIYQCVQGKKQIPNRGPASLGADDFLPMLIYVLVHSGMVSAEIEADYMWGLLNQTLQSGEGGYYLTTFSSAVLVLRNFKQTHEMTSHQSRLPSISDMQGFLKVALPDEIKDSITWKTLPVRPNMNTKDVCAMIAHKFKITNPQDYGLYLLVQGTETTLADNVCPQLIKSEHLGKGVDCYFAYKRKAANIAWPKNMKKPSVGS